VRLCVSHQCHAPVAADPGEEDTALWAVWAHAGQFEHPTEWKRSMREAVCPLSEHTSSTEHLPPPETTEGRTPPASKTNKVWHPMIQTLERRETKSLC